MTLKTTNVLICQYKENNSILNVTLILFNTSCRYGWCAYAIFLNCCLSRFVLEISEIFFNFI